ncbi:Hypothetical protein FKW44_015501, partial [Caligus rogercresseyi]
MHTGRLSILPYICQPVRLKTGQVGREENLGHDEVERTELSNEDIEVVHSEDLDEAGESEPLSGSVEVHTNPDG